MHDEIAVTWRRERTASPHRASTFTSLAAVCVLAAAIHLLVIQLIVNPYDESLILYGATRVARGGLPYRDFWTLYGPGSFYALGALFRLFGESVAVARAFLDGWCPLAAYSSDGAAA